jgi:hypothetical protein
MSSARRAHAVRSPGVEKRTAEKYRFKPVAKKMGEISCAYCLWGCGDVVGTAAEDAYFRVVDATKPDESYDEFAERKREARKQGIYAKERQLKKFYCTTQCYADSVFVSTCARSVRVDPSEVRADVRNLLCSDPLVQKRMVLWSDRYSELTADARAMPSFIAFGKKEIACFIDAKTREAALEDAIMNAKEATDV